MLRVATTPGTAVAREIVCIQSQDCWRRDSRLALVVERVMGFQQSSSRTDRLRRAVQLGFKTEAEGEVSPLDRFDRIECCAFHVCAS